MNIPKMDLTVPFYSVPQLARKLKRTNQSIYLCIKSGKLKAHKKKNSQWLITPIDIINYYKSRYDRQLTKDANGNKLFDPTKGAFSVSQISKSTGIPIHKIYYLIRINAIPYEKYRSQYIVKGKSFKEIAKLINNYKKKLKKKTKNE